MPDEMKCNSSDVKKVTYTQRLEKIVEEQTITLKNLDSILSKLWLWLTDPEVDNVACDSCGNSSSIETLISRISRNNYDIVRATELIERAI